MVVRVEEVLEREEAVVLVAAELAVVLVVRKEAELAVGWVGVVSQVAGLAGLVERAVQVVAERVVQEVAERVVAQEVVAEWAGRVVA